MMMDEMIDDKKLLFKHRNCITINRKNQGIFRKRYAKIRIIKETGASDIENR